MNRLHASPQALSVLAGPDILTPREKAIASIAPTGASTREIATAAFLSPKTVEIHLTRLCRQVGVRSTAQLAYHLAVSA